ncbi:protein regulator of cytokinesis 1-like [Macrosteles quadrilineatus]|uniref:protein regulator of cytokinesis 1-like n=1 Tax=Macrosteles quadrilineatus TaxID=74068 RepID=UPI0023E2EE78|nr:protein regulator of cytokinesis 1-like [Macrosteles quadrilineatus]
MSGDTGESHGKDVELQQMKNTFIQINVEGIEEMIKLWNEIYGPMSVSDDRFTKLIDDVKAFWEQQLECQNERKKNLSKSIEKAGKDALKLEKALGLEAEVQNLACDKDDPLVVLEDKIWKILTTYQEIREKRLEEYNHLQKKERELCVKLSLKSQREERLSFKKVANSKQDDIFIPGIDQINTLKERIDLLEKQNEQLKYDFETYKDKLRLLVEKCKFKPNKEIEQYFSSEKEDYPITTKRLNQLIATTNHYQKMQEELVHEADHLRNEVASLSKKMFLNTDEIETFLSENNGFDNNTIDNLKKKLKNLKDDRKKNLKDLIISQRKVLNDLWDKCCYSEGDRAQFKAYQSNHWSEEVLSFHEMEIEKLQRFYEENKKIFQLSSKYDELWMRLLHLEELASNKDRLFNNRGGCLLKEEKERRLIQKKVPSIKTELTTLLNTYKNTTGKDFMLFGKSLQSKIEEKEDEREKTKETERLMRKTVNKENMFLESRLGFKQSFSDKRRLLTPQHPNNYPRVMKTAHSTPRISRSASTLSGSTVSESTWTRVLRENKLNGNSSITSFQTKSHDSKVARRLQCGTPCTVINKFSNNSQTSLTYESFKENIKSASKHNQTLVQPNRVLRPRNGNKACSEKKNCTPVTKMTLKSSTSSKIPRPTTPIVPNIATRTTNSRRKLPIIF